MEIKIDKLSTIGFITVEVLLLAIIIFYPFVLIWSINTLFASLSIPYSFWTWLAMTLLNLGVFGSIRHKLNKIAEKL